MHSHAPHAFAMDPTSTQMGMIGAPVRYASRSACLALALIAAPVVAFESRELAGEPLAAYPYFEFVRAVNADRPVTVAVDTTQVTGLAGVAADLYVVEHSGAHVHGEVLVDLSAAVESHVFVPGSVVANTLVVAAPGELAAASATDVGRGYDVVIDVDRNGVLGAVDLVDGGADEAGFYVVRDLVAAGPLPVAVIDYAVSGATPGFARERTWYPSGIAGLGALPLVIISHGNGHDYAWYDYLQQHLASYGYVVMSHQNNTMPGVQSAATTTLEHTDAFLGQLASIGGGVLDGHVDSTRIVWIGHSRGGEGVTIAYTRIRDGVVVPANYAIDDIALVSSIAPTAFFGPTVSNPQDVTFHMLYGSADGDVAGSPGNNVIQAFQILERVRGPRQSTYVHGADHNDFNCCGFDDFIGPPGTEIGRAEAQRIAKADYLALIKHHVEGSVAARDYLWRQHQRLRPIGVSQTTTVVRELKDGPGSGKQVIDDFQSNPSLLVSSEGGFVLPLVADAREGVADDNDSSFAWTAADPFNGLTRAAPGDDTRAFVFSVPQGVPLPVIVWYPPQPVDARAYRYLSFRAAQMSRHPLTTARLGDEGWFVLLIDGGGGAGLVALDAYGAGVGEPYQRGGFGPGAGWQAEFETVRIRLEDFLTGRDGVASTLDLSDIRRVAMVFLGVSGQSGARLAIDDIELVAD